MSKLFIVESPAKAGTIKKFLPQGTKVLASMGHLRDLPKSRLAVDIENDFEPEYINVRGKGDLIKKLKAEAKGKDVYLATDPDREGEAIAWHLAHILDIPLTKESRVTFNEITKEEVQKAAKNPRKIDQDLVDAQQSRRILDRLVGFQISPLLWANIKSGLSAGRVQSATLKLIIDRENEIRNFVPEEYWTLNAILSDGDKEFISKFYGRDKKIELTNKEQVDNILKEIKNEDFKVVDLQLGTKKKNPTPPFTTSTLQQDASRKLNFTIKKTMAVAQGLYEGIKVPERGLTGLITYMRTDSTRISEQARTAAKKVIEEKFGKEFYENRYYKQSKDSQDAHEAIRPSYPDIDPDSIKAYLTPDQYKLYSLIYKRFIASQMTPAIYNTIRIKLNVNGYEFRSSGQTLKFQGFLKVYNIEEDKSEESDFVDFPNLKVGDVAKLISFDPIQSFTAPPARYTEASLVKVLEENGIGRPSTYSPTISTIIERRYIKKEKKNLVPTELGEIVNNVLIKHFDNIIDAKFTAQVEKDLDEVAEGKVYWKDLLKEFYIPFEKQLNEAKEKMEKIVIQDEVSDEVCDICGKPMVYKHGRYGKFLACSGFPECKNTKTIVVTIEEKCPICGGTIHVRKSKRGLKYYICENNKKDVEGACEYYSYTKPGEEKKDKKKEKDKKVEKKTTNNKTTKASTKASSKSSSKTKKSTKKK